MKKSTLLIFTILFALGSHASTFDCSVQQIDEDEYAVGPFTVVIQDNVGSIYVGDGGDTIDHLPRTGAEALAKATELCEGFNR